MMDILDLLNESPTWNNHSVPEPKEQMNKGLIHVLIGTVGTGKTTYAQHRGISEYDHSGDLGELAVVLVSALTRNREHDEEYLERAVSMHNEHQDAINLIRSVAEYFGRPVRIVRITEYDA